MKPAQTTPSLGDDLAICLAEAAAAQRAQTAANDVALEKYIKRSKKRESRWLNKSGSLLDAIGRRVEKKGLGSVLMRLFFRRRQRLDREILHLLREMRRRDKEHYGETQEMLKALLQERRGPLLASAARPEHDATLNPAATRAITTVMLDLRGLELSGINGGLQSYVLWLIPWLRAHHRDEFRFLALARPENLSMVSGLLGCEDAVIVQGDRHQLLQKQSPQSPAQAETSLPLDVLAEQMNVDVLYSPLGPLAFHKDGIRSISLIADLLHREMPDCLPPGTNKLRERYISHVAENATLIQCISCSGQERMEHHFPVARGKTFFTYLPVHERLEVARKVPSDSRAIGTQPFFFYPANFWPHKNHRVLLLAYQIYAHEAGENAWNLVLSGNDYEGTVEQIRQLADKLCLSKKVTVTGYVSDEALAQLWQNAGALVFPSLHEGFGIPLLEAMRYQTPILSAPDYSMLEVAGPAALYFNPKKPIQIAARMKELAGDPALSQRLREAGSARLERFNPEREMLLLVEALKGGHPQRASVEHFKECGCPKW